MTVLLYHAVTPDGHNELNAGIPIGGTSFTAFDRHIRQFATWYTPINIEELEQILEGKQSLSEDKFLVTFDDAYLNNRNVAGPCLQKYNVPALIFVPTAYIETGRCFWWTRIRELMNDISESKWQEVIAELAHPHCLSDAMSRTTVSSPEDRIKTYKELEHLLDSLDARDQESVIAQIEQYCRPRDLTMMPLLRWNEMHEMQDEGFAFGSHTHSHIRLSRLPPKQIQDELLRNTSILEEKLEKRPRSFAYPYGDYDDSVLREVSREGFNIAFSVKADVIDPTAFSSLELPRLQPYRTRNGEIALTILVLKLMKYLPRLMKPIALRLIA